MSDEISRPAVAGHSHTINKFCELENISRAYWYKMPIRPRVFYVGNSPRISEEARTEWRRRMEAEAEARNTEAA